MDLTRMNPDRPPAGAEDDTYLAARSRVDVIRDRARARQEGAYGHGRPISHDDRTRAGELMSTDVKWATHDQPLIQVAAMMRDAGVGIVPVVDRDLRLAGVVTDRDLVVRAGADGKDFTRLRAQDVMTEGPIAVSPEAHLLDVIEVMSRHRIRRVPVVDADQRVLGIVSIDDVARHADRDEETQEALQRIAARRTFWHSDWR
jgi:CBS domain-containing protein